MTKTVCSEDMIKISHEANPTFEEKIASRNTIVDEPLVDPAIIRITAEKLKDQIFTRYDFLRPEPDDVALVCVEKSYERFIVITGKYAYRLLSEAQLHVQR